MYDAREVLTVKLDMPPYSALDLKKDDLVLLESNITRYRVKDTDNKWSSQRVQMEMLAISLLFSADAPEAKQQSGSCDVCGLRI